MKDCRRLSSGRPSGGDGGVTYFPVLCRHHHRHRRCSHHRYEKTWWPLHGDHRRRSP
jgi:hypothetical protein